MPEKHAPARPSSKTRYSAAGKVLNHSSHDHGLHFELENGQARVSWIESGVLRVQLWRAGHDPADNPPSYAVVQEAQPVSYETSSSDDSITLSSDQAQVRIGLNPFRVDFCRKDGTSLVKDDDGLGAGWQGSGCAVYKHMRKGERFIGLGEKTQGPDRRGNAYENWNTDAFAYGEGSDPLYGSYPFYIGVHDDGVYGVFMDSPQRTRFNFGASQDRFCSFEAVEGEIDYYLFAGEEMADIVKAYARLTGLMTMPPRWSMGYQQCRYSYYPETRMHQLADGFRDRKIPCDVLYYDIHYMDRYRVFTWDKDRFPDPAKLNKELADRGFRTVIIADPGVADAEDYPPYQEAKEAGLFVSYPDGTEYQGDVWPGTCGFPDFTSAATRKWWAESIAKFVKESNLDGVWNDMNEPASWGQSTPDLIEFDYEGYGATHRQARNVYGMQMARASREGLELNAPDKRPFVLTRAGYSGIQRYAAVWTGDNTSSDESMLVGARMLSSMGLTGMPFTGYDVGGFCGEADPELYSRWISIATFAPFFRGHTMINTKESQPWSYGEEAENIARNAINLRYQLMPYIYSIFHEASETGMPLCRSLALEWPQEALVYDGRYGNQYLFGPGFMVCPIAGGQKISQIFLPEGRWHYLFDDTVYEGGEHYIDSPSDRLPVFVRAGSIVPMQNRVQHTGETPDGELRLHVWKGEGSFRWYDDDGESYEFQNGAYASRLIEVTESGLKIAAQEGNYDSPFQKVRVYLHGFGKLDSVNVNGSSVATEIADHSHIDQIPDFDPWLSNHDEKKIIKDLPSVTADFGKDAIELSW